MKKCWALILALCMFLSSAAVAETSCATEEVLLQIVEVLANGWPFWVTYADDAAQLAGGVVLDEEGMPGVGARWVKGDTDLYAAVDAHGVRYSDGKETLNTTWEGLLGASLPSDQLQLTEADQQMLMELLTEAFTPVGELVQVVNADAELNGAPAQSVEIVLPLRKICQTLDESMTAAIQSRHEQLVDLVMRNQRFLRELGLRVQDPAVMWKELNLSGLIPVEVDAVARYTEADSAWKVEASVLGAGIEVNCDGTHVDGRVYAGAQQWVFDTRDLEVVAGWLQEILRSISPQALDLSFHEDGRTLRLHAKVNAQQLVGQFFDGMDLLTDKYAEQVQAIVERYAPIAQLLGADVPEKLELKPLIQQLRMRADRSVAMWQMRNVAMYTTNGVPIELDVYLADGEALSLVYYDGNRRVELDANQVGMELNVGVLRSRSTYRVSGVWGADVLRVSGTVSRGDTVNSTWELTGTVENGVRVLSFMADDEWVATCTLREDSAELTSSSGVKGTVVWDDQGFTLHGSDGEQMLDASVRVGDRQITAGVSAAGYEGSVWLRQEGDATRAQLKWQYSRNSKMQHFYQLETAIGGDRMMFKAGSYSRYMLQDAPYWEVGLDMRPGQFSGSLYNRRTQASFLWTPGLLKASSNYRMSGLTTDTQILVRDVTQQGVDYNVTQIDWDQKLIYQDEVIEKKYVYTARSAVEQDVLHVDIDGPNGWKAEASFAVMEDAAKLDELLGIGAEAAAPQTVAEPTVEPTVEPEATKAPVNGVFLSGPKK